jgi:hypothetical protein
MLWGKDRGGEETYLGRLVDEEHIGASVPAPHTRLSAVRSIRHFNHFAGAIFVKHANHAATSRSTIDPDCQRCSLGVLSCLCEPEKGVDTVVLLYRLQREWWEAYD